MSEQFRVGDDYPGADRGQDKFGHLELLNDRVGEGVGTTEISGMNLSKLPHVY